MTSEAAMIANTYTPGIAAAIERGDENGALTLFHMATDHMHKSLGLSHDRARTVLFWSMTGVATAMLRRVAKDGSAAELIAELAQRQHTIHHQRYEC